MAVNVYAGLIALGIFAGLLIALGAGVLIGVTLTQTPEHYDTEIIW